MVKGTLRGATSRDLGAVEAASASLTLEAVVRRINASTTEILKEDGLTLEQWRVLDCLAERGEMPMTELAAAVSVPAPTVTRIVDKLVSRALVYRSSGMNDRRRVLVHASQRGDDLRARLAPQVTGVHASAFDRLTPEQQGRLFELLHLLGAPA